MTLALPNPSMTPIFDELDAHFFSTPRDIQSHGDPDDVIDAHVVAVRDTPLDHTEGTAPAAGTLTDLLGLALWILTLGAAVGTVIWLYIVITTGVFS
ncbi:MULTISPECIES: hypothetical protein [Rhodococcus]|uniref:hypothetical protein n=1 Tax=Rhodococcus TaxID=1827 RepID=UPI001E4DC509|nr:MULTISPECIES: hypothetical protein [Rhodococcus]BDB58944.1 hypothetical protein RDE2_07380 [Rhodococcus sp. RDE2]